EGRLAAQYRTLTELAVLARREQGEADPARRADLRLRRAQVLRKAPWTTLPVWTERHVSFGRALARARIGADADARLEAYVASAFPLRRAAALLETLVDELPGFAGRDRALFALGHCRADLLDDWPTK